MRKLLAVAVVLVCAVSVLFAGEAAYFKMGSLEFTVPVRDDFQIVSLYDVWQAEALLGAETRIATYKRLNLNAGAVSSFLGKGTPYLSIDYDFTDTKPKVASIGLFAGRDFNIHEWRAGIKASTPLW